MVGDLRRRLKSETSGPTISVYVSKTVEPFINGRCHNDACPPVDWLMRQRWHLLGILETILGRTKPQRLADVTYPATFVSIAVFP
jgi:hypothetical protein